MDLVIIFPSLSFHLFFFQEAMDWDQKKRKPKKFNVKMIYCGIYFQWEKHKRIRSRKIPTFYENGRLAFYSS